MKILDYFDLGFVPEEAELGTKQKSTQKSRRNKRLLLTLLIYLFVWLGVLGQKFLASLQAGENSLGQGFPVVALIIATALFPAVFPKTFNKRPSGMQKSDPNVWYFLQICVAFQNGFFWQALLGLLTPK